MFALVPGPESVFLNIQWIGKSAVLRWNGSGYSLQTPPGAAGVYTNISFAASPYTNLTTFGRQFFRLK
ncbi:MAG: hypothetical protein ACREE6_08640 [Limisphaerales bacterium]